MKLIPRAKPIRIRISAGGEEHSSLDTFLQQYDIESMLSLYKNGSLIRWLNQIGASAIIERLNNLKINNFEAVTNEECIKFVSAIYGGDISDVAFEIVRYYETIKNREQILRWHDIAYKYGNMDSAFELGLIYRDGLYGVEESALFAFTYFSIAADGGNNRAQLFLSTLYEKGEGVEQSNERAIEYLEMAANANFVGAYFSLGRLLSKVKRYDDAEKWLKLALEHLGSEHPDYTEALNLLGDLYYEKDQKDPKVYEYYHKAAIRGSSRAKFNLGYLYEDGIGGVSQDENQSLYWYKSAAKDGYAPAQCSVGRYYYEKDDYETAIPWLQKAVEQEVIGAKVIYSLCLIQFEKFPEKAYNLMHEAANANDSAAQYYMGCFYKKGFLVRKNINQAIVWYKKAAENGSKDAKARLSELGEFTLKEVAKELKVGIQTIADFLENKGYEHFELSPSTKLTHNMYSLIIKEFKS